MTGQANRGMSLEQLINHANAQYLSKGVAVVHKRPTPVKILKTQGSRITSAVLESKSTVDYQGVYNGHALEFEAKQTTEKASFPLKNFHAHQVEHIRKCMQAGAICFVVMEFTKHHEIYFVPGKLIVDAWDAAERGGRKSIPHDDVQVMCYELKSGNGVALDYLSVVDRLIETKEVC